MSLALLVTGTLAMSGPTAVKFALFGDEIAASPANTFKTLAQGSSSVAAATIYTVTGPVTQTIVKTMIFANTAGSPSAVVIYANGTAAVNQIFAATIPTGGTLTYGPAGWQMNDSTGAVIVTAAPITATGDATGTQSGSSLPLTLATVNGAPGTTGSATQVSVTAVNAKGLVTSNTNVSIQIAESQVTNLVSDLAGKQPTGNYITALTGDGTATGPGSVAFTLATVNGNVGTFGSATQVAQPTFNAKGLATACANVAIQIAESQVTNLVTDLAGKQATGNYITALTGDVTATGPGSAAATLANSGVAAGTYGSSTLIPVVTYDAKGRATSVTTVAVATGGLTGWIDVTLQASPVLPGNTAATNNANINTILAAAPNGSTIYFPHGIYLFSASWTMPANKAFTFQGQGSNRAGSPGTAFTEIQLTTNLAATFITLNNVWYTQFRDMIFTAGATQTVGACIDVGNNVGTNFINCAFQSPNTVAAPTTFWNDVLSGTATNSWNQAVILQCNFSAFKGRGVVCDGTGSSLVIANSVIQGNWGGFTGTPAANSATACVEGLNVGALQIVGCDVLGAINNLLLDPGAGKVCASVFVTNSYFDNSAGSCVKIAGAGATVRARFDTCSFTTAGTNYSTAGTNLFAFELAGTFAFTAPGGGSPGQGIDIVNCNILNTFGTTGTTNGFIATNGSDFSVTNSRIAGWTNGIQVTPIATAGVTRPAISNNQIGSVAGYAANGTGILLNAGAAAYGTIAVTDNALDGNTVAALNEGANVVVGAMKNIRNNSGYMQGLGDLQLVSNAGGANINARGAVTSGAADTVLFGVKIPAGGVSSVTNAAHQKFDIKLTGRSSSTGTLIFKIHIGAAGTTADTAVWTSTTTAAQVNNAVAEFNAIVTWAGAVGVAVAEGLVRTQPAITTPIFVGNLAIAAETQATPTTSSAWFITVSCTCSTGTFTVNEGYIRAV